MLWDPERRQRSPAMRESGCHRLPQPLLSRCPSAQITDFVEVTFNVIAGGAVILYVNWVGQRFASVTTSEYVPVQVRYILSCGIKAWSSPWKTVCGSCAAGCYSYETRLANRPGILELLRFEFTVNELGCWIILIDWLYNIAILNRTQYRFQKRHRAATETLPAAAGVHV